MEPEAKRLYEAVMRTLQEIGIGGLLAAAGDAKSKVSWDKASPKTRDIFLHLAANLTDSARAA